ncbi:MAG: CHAT domain-containing tetratricopeptide repeat protein [Bacteroidota bacterium]
MRSTKINFSIFLLVIVIWSCNSEAPIENQKRFQESFFKAYKLDSSNRNSQGTHLENYIEVINAYEEAIDNYEALNKNHTYDTLIMDTYSYIADNYREIQKFKTAELFYSKAFEISVRLFPDDYIIPLYLSVSRSLSNQYSLEEIEPLLTSIERKLDTEAISDGHDEIDQGLNILEKRARFYNEKAFIYNAFNNYQKARGYAQKSLQIANKLKFDGGLTWTNLSLLGNISLAQQKYPESIGFHKRALNFLSNRKEDSIINYNNLGFAHIYNDPENPSKGISFFQSAAKLLFPDLIDFQVSTTLTHIGYPTIDKALNLKGHGLANFYSYRYGKGDTAKLKLSINQFRAVRSIFHELRTNMKLEEDRLIFSKITENTFEVASIACLDYYRETKDWKLLEEAFSFSELSKALVLGEHITESSAKIKGLDALSLKLFRSLTDSIMLMRSVVGLARSGPEIADKLANYLKKKDSTLSDWKAKYPAYYSRQFENSTLSIKEIQQRLEPNRAMISYLVSGDSLLTFLIQKDSVNLFTSYFNEGLITDFYEGLSNSNNDLSPKAFLEIAKPLSDMLIGQVYEKLKVAGIERLLIIPDGIIGLVPFSTLITPHGVSGSRFKDFPYLGLEFALSFGYSATSWDLIKDTQQSRSDKKSYLGIAPEINDVPKSSNSERFENILGSQEDVQAMSQIFDGKITTLQGHHATKEDVLEELPHHSIIYFCTHAVGDSLNPNRSFILLHGEESPKNRLFLPEIQALNLNSDMVIFSACQTASGKVYDGEGIASLALAFSYAGSRSQLATLWKLNFSMNTPLIIPFFEELNKKDTHMQGYPSKDIAFQRALVKFFQRKEMNELYHPSQWAALELIGNMDPIY